MNNKIQAVATVCHRKITRKKVRTFMNMLMLGIAVILLVGYGSIIKTFVQGLNDFNYVTSSGIKSNGYFSFTGENKDLYNVISTESDSEIAFKKEYDIKVKDNRFDSKLNSLVSINQEYLDKSALKLQTGRLATKDNEIVLPKDFTNLLNKNIDIQLEINGENTTRSFKVVGIYDVVNGNTNFRHLLVNNDYEMNQNVITEYYIYSPSLDQQKMNRIASEHNIEYIENPYQGLNVNLYVGIGIALISLLIFALIKNINEIFTKLDDEENRKLSYIGVNSSRLTVLNIFYTLCIFVVPTIIGLVFANLLYYYSMPIILSFTDFSGMTNVQIHSWLVIVSVIIILFIYFFTLNKRLKNKTNYKKFAKLKKIDKKLIEKDYSLRSISLNKKKHTSIIVSLTVTLSLLAIVLITTISLDPQKHAQNNNIYDVQIKGNRLENGIDSAPIEIPGELQSDSSLDIESNHLLYQQTETGLQSYISIKINKEISAVDLPMKLDDTKDAYLSTVAGLAPNYFTYISNKYSIEGDSYSDTGVMYYRKSGTTDNIKIGDKVNLQVEVDGEYREINTTVETIITDKNSNDNNYDQNLAVFNFSSDSFVELFGDSYINMIGINDVNKSELSEITSSISGNANYDIQTYESFKKIIENFRMFLVSFGIIGSLLLFIDSLLNIACTQISNCISRSKELATLEAIGCSKKRIISILVKEANYYLIRCFILSLFMILGSLLLIKNEIAFSDTWFINFILIYIIIMVGIYLINHLIIIACYRHISKQSISNRINN